MSRRYVKRFQTGSLQRETRRRGPDVWIFRFRDGQMNRKEQVGTVEQFTNKTAALKACELLRSKLNRGTRAPHSVMELVSNYNEHELPIKTPYTREVYEGLSPYLDCAKVGNAAALGCKERGSGILVGHVAVSEWYEGQTAKSHARRLYARYALGICEYQPNFVGEAICQA